MKTTKAIFENLRKFDVEYVSFNGQNLAVIRENGAEVWSVYANSEKSLKSKVTKWCKQNWI